MLCLLATSCGIYSFTGGSIPEGIESITVERFENNAPLVVPSLSQDFTEALRQKFIRQTNLEMQDYEGDMQFSGAITKYAVAPEAITGNEVASQNRLTIGVKVSYVNTKYPEKNWDKSFAQFSLFSADQSLTEVEATLIEEIVDRLAQDIFNKALSNW